MEAEVELESPSEDQKVSSEGLEMQASGETYDEDVGSYRYAEVFSVAPTLPPSSGDIDLPEKTISYFFSVYNFLRSFSRQLFLSPFGPDDFVGALNCAIPNSLLDAVHVALLRALKRHLEVTEGVQLAAKCLRHQDWNLIDNLTWPVFLIEYLYIMDYVKELTRLGLENNLLNTEYHRLPVPTKLWILHTLCDDVLDSADITAELETRENMDEEKDFMSASESVLENRPRRVHPRYAKTSACKDAEALKNSVEPLKMETRSKASQPDASGAEISFDENSDECSLCGMDGTLICCDGCPFAYHTRCIGVSKASLPDKWFCPECVINKLSPISSKIGRGLRGAEIFGTDPYGRSFYGTCHYLLVLGISTSANPCSRYYNQDDVNNLLSALFSEKENAFDYSCIAQGILKYFDLPSSILLTNNGSRTEGVQVNAFAPNQTQGIPLKNDLGPNALPSFEGGHELKISKVNGIIGISPEHKQGNGKDRSKTSHFRPYQYLNQYFYGDVAASAAANMATLDPLESAVAESVSVSNSKKILAVQITNQMKAFSMASGYFLWPNSEKKAMEVPRERCGWCIACKGASTTKKGCLLNLAALSIFKLSARYISSLSLLKSDETHRSVIAAHVSNMEKSLRGLLVGSLSNPNLNKQWHQRLCEASSCRILKFLLLELEESIRSIVLSGSWYKFVDDGLADLSAATLANYNAGPNQKRGTHGRRGKKQAVTPESSSEEDGWMWWQGWKISRVLQKWALPEVLLRKASRQGGFRCISGVSYPDSSELPRRSRQFVWRTSVENCRNMSQLALQVRYLDGYVRWRDLVRPEQAPLDGKGFESDTSVFRNAVICDKKTVDDKILYGLSFSNQKHLPLRVTKSFVEAEDTQDGNKKLWFWDVHIPLYLIKTYEEKLEQTHPAKESTPSCRFSVVKTKTCWKDPFTYLWNKEKMSKIVSCAFCKKDVVMRDAVKCNTCQGSCHWGCATISTAKIKDDSRSLHTCNTCVRSQLSTIMEKKPYKTVIFKLSSQKQGQPSVDTNPKPQAVTLDKTLSGNQLEASREAGLNAFSSGSVRKRKPPGEIVTFGLIWKRKKEDQASEAFRLNNIILKCKNGLVPSRTPTCALCGKPYCSDLMYICCEKCSNWFHADALHFEEAQIPDLLGFKCNKCRRKGIPKCPYSNSFCKKQDRDPPLKKEKVERTELAACNSNVRVEQTPPILSNLKDEDSSFSDYHESPMEFLGNDDKIPVHESESDIQLCGSGSVDHFPHEPSTLSCQVEYAIGADEFYNIDESNSAPPTAFSRSLQKLPVRRNDVQHETVVDEYFTGSENAPASEVVWDASNFDGGVHLDDAENGHIEDTEFEPQTYFSFTELLACEDGELNELGDKTIAEDGDWILSMDSGDFGVTFSDNCNSNECPLVGVPCEKCKIDDPSADLTCAACGLLIHSYCSPWEESEELLEYGQWKCGNCREWR